MDMLIKLCALPDTDTLSESIRRQNIRIRRAMAYERRKLIDWVHENFNPLWADECAVAFGRQPIGCYLAVKGDAICGFCCLDVTYRNFIGPIGIASKCRSKGVGRYLVLTAAEELHKAGFAYAIVGDAGEPEFFRKAANAIGIPDSAPGPYPPKLAGEDG